MSEKPEQTESNGETQPVQAATRRGRIRHFFTNPWVGVIGSICSIIGIPLAFYLGSRHAAPRLCYSVSPARAAIVTPGSISKLKTTYDGKEIEGDVSAAQVTIWNDGDEPIVPASILEPIAIAVNDQGSPADVVLEATIARESRPLIATKLDQSQNQKGSVGVDWRILEPGDACQIQVVYSGKLSDAIAVSGALIRQKSPKNVVAGTNRYSVILQVAGLSIWLLSSMVIAFGLVSLLKVKRDPAATFLIFLAFFIGILVLWLFKSLVDSQIGNVPFN